MTDLTALRGKVDSLLRERDFALKTAAREETALEEARDTLEAARQAQTLLQGVAQKVQESAHRQIAKVVTRALRAVFGENAYEFQIDFERKRGKTEARLLFARGGRTFDPLGAAGGGVVDVAAFALRLAALLLARPTRRRLLVLDEPFRFVHGEGNRERVAELLLTLSREFGVQVLMATGLDYLKVGKVVKL